VGMVGTSGVAGITVFLNQKLYETVPLSQIQTKMAGMHFGGRVAGTTVILL
jgi:hypothetical protein